MGLFDSKSKTVTDTTTQNAAFSEIGGGATSLNIRAGGKKSVTTVNALDGGAIGKAFDFATSSNAAALKQVELAGAQSAALVRESVAAVSESARDDAENVTLTAIKWGAVALVAWAAFGAMRRGAA